MVRTSTVSLYINGLLDCSANKRRNLYTGSTKSLHIGASSSATPANFWSGSIADFRAYSRGTFAHCRKFKLHDDGFTIHAFNDATLAESGSRCHHEWVSNSQLGRIKVRYIRLGITAHSLYGAPSAPEAHTVANQ